MDAKCLSVSVALCVLFVCIHGDVSTTTTVPTPQEQACLSPNNTACESCLSNKDCFWCTGSKKCQPYSISFSMPANCSLGDVYFGTCTVNLMILVIVCGSLAGVVVLAISCCIIYCCCCRRRRGRSSRETSEDDTHSAEYNERRARNAQRRAERESRWNEIRQKYGLGSSTNAAGTAATYSRFDNETA